MPEERGAFPEKAVELGTQKIVFKREVYEPRARHIDALEYVLRDARGDVPGYVAGRFFKRAGKAHGHRGGQVAHGLLSGDFHLDMQRLAGANGLKCLF